VFASTASVYGQRDVICSESTDRNPLSYYAETKCEAEDILKPCNNAVVFRLGTAHGLGDRFGRTRFDLVLNRMVADAVRNGLITVHNDLNWRPMCHVRDIARALVAAATSTMPPDLYNFATSNTRICDVATCVQRLTDCSIQHSPSPDHRSYQSDLTKVLSCPALQNIVLNGVTMQDSAFEIIRCLREGRVADVDAVHHNNGRALREWLSRPVKNPRLVIERQYGGWCQDANKEIR
jgi:nucleoside-diphosphate-sugar epimerase